MEKTIVCEGNKVNNGGERARREEYERAVVLIPVGRESQYKYFGVWTARAAQP
jgi:hypothetical protein